MVRARFSENNPGQVTGYAVTLAGHVRPDGTPLWYGGGRLAAGLTLPRLRERWDRRPGVPTERSGTALFTDQEREQVYRHTARQAAMATEHIRRYAMTDPGAAADAAWAAADTLHVAARVLRSRHLRCAADSYDRAARAQHGRVPQRSRDGERLRRTARLIALAGDLTGDTTLAAVALVAQLVALAVAVAEMRQAQQHTAQAGAARAAAAHLHSAVPHVRSRVPGSGRVRSHGPAPANAAELASVDYPADVKPCPSATDQAEPARVHSPQQHGLPRRRVGPGR
jgi:hypothetical protein